MKLHQSMNLPAIGATTGLARGTLWGVFLNPAVGAIAGGAIGAASGAVGGAVTDYGISDDFMKELGGQLQPGSSALFVLIKISTPDKVVPEVARFGGKILRSSLSNEAEERLQAALDAGTAVRHRKTITPLPS